MARKSKFKKLEERLMNLLITRVESIIDKITPENALLMYLGYTRLPQSIDPIVRLAWPLVGLQLATTPSTGGEVKLNIFGVQFPVNSQIGGLSMLAVVGFACLPWEEVAKKIAENIEETREQGEKAEKIKPSMSPDEQTELVRLQKAVITAAVSTSFEYAQAMTEYRQFVTAMEEKYQSNN